MGNEDKFHYRNRYYPLQSQLSRVKQSLIPPFGNLQGSANFSRSRFLRPLVSHEPNSRISRIQFQKIRLMMKKTSVESQMHCTRLASHQLAAREFRNPQGKIRRIDNSQPTLGTFCLIVANAADPTGPTTAIRIGTAIPLKRRSVANDSPRSRSAGIGRRRRIMLAIFSRQYSPRNCAYSRIHTFLYRLSMESKYLCQIHF